MEQKQEETPMGEIMIAEEINARFESEWVLVADPETEENLTVTRGKVLWHGKDKGQLHDFVRELQRPFSLAVLYTGKLPKDQEFMLSVFPANDFTS
ncbi:MAG: hypothetical protein ABIO92_03010 [Chloroflexia bacterium]